MVENQSDRKLLESLGMQLLAEHTGGRALPWPVDILLYPWSTSGLVHLLAMTLVVIGIDLGRRWLPGRVRPSCQARIYPSDGLSLDGLSVQGGGHLSPESRGDQLLVERPPGQR